MAAYLGGLLLARPAFLDPVRRRLPFLAAVALCFVGLCIARPALCYLAAPAVLFPLQRIVIGPPGSLVRFLGINAGPIYVWHTPIIMPFVSIILAKYLSSPWLLIPALTALTIAISIAVAQTVRLFDRYGVLVM